MHQNCLPQHGVRRQQPLQTGTLKHITELVLKEVEVLRVCGRVKMGYCGLVPEDTRVTPQDNEGVFSEVLVGKGQHDLCLRGT